jgi:protein-disulfide isomerase
LEFKQYPFLSQESTWAAEAALCANDQEMFWPYHDMLFENRGSYTRANLVRFAEILELDTITFDDCFESGKYSTAVQDQKAEGATKGVESTPTVLTNGIKIVGARPFEDYEVIIEQELADASGS